MTTQLSNFLSNYARVLFVLAFKKKLFAVTDMTAMTSALLFPSESKGSGFHVNERSQA